METMPVSPLNCENRNSKERFLPAGASSSPCCSYDLVESFCSASSSGEATELEDQHCDLLPQNLSNISDASSDTIHPLNPPPSTKRLKFNEMATVIGNITDGDSNDEEQGLSPLIVSCSNSSSSTITTTTTASSCEPMEIYHKHTARPEKKQGNKTRILVVLRNCLCLVLTVSIIVAIAMSLHCHNRHINIPDGVKAATTPETITQVDTESTTVIAAPVEETTSYAPEIATHPNNNLRPNPKQTYPKVAWLMSFPNSGTSYTMALVESASNRTMASNYAWEGDETTAENVVDGTTNGPYWRYDPEKSLKESARGRPHSGTYALTKTHCGGYCHDCQEIISYIETPHSFMRHCASSKIRPSPQKPSISHVYDYNYVDRAVHLIRDPFDNIVSRYHNDIENVAARSSRQNKDPQNGNKGRRDDVEERYTYDPEGFLNFCQDKMNDLQKELLDANDLIDQEALEIMKDVPCHLDFFRYIQWHNLAFITTQDNLQIDTMVLHYDDYDKNFNGTLEGLLDFLDLSNTGNYKSFKSGKSYRNYFSRDHIHAVEKATKLLSSPITWEHLEKYFFY